MPQENGEVQAFQFNIDSFEEMKAIYVTILEQLGITGAYDKISEAYSSIPPEQRNGLMFGKMISELFESDDERRAQALEAFERIKDDRNISPYVKAYLAEMSGDYIPYDTVLTAARMVGGEEGKNGKSLQMGCGEGKTGVLSMAAYAILQSKSQKKQVFLTSSTETLAAEALDKIEFYDRVGMAEDVVLVDSKGVTRVVVEDGKAARDNDGNVVFERIDFENKSEKVIKEILEKAYGSRLVIADNVTLMQDAMKGYLPPPSKNVKRELLADEADFVLLDSYRPLQRTEPMSETEMESIVEQRQLAYRILESVKKQIPKEKLFVKDDSSQYVDFTNEGRKLIVDAIRNSKKSAKVDMNTLYDYVYDALVVDTVYKKNRDYQILNRGKKIVSEDRASGVGIDLPEGVKQALEIKLQQEGKYRGPISPERKVLDTLNTQTFFKNFFNGTKHFVSGTLGVDSHAIAEELKRFGVNKEEDDIYEIPPKEKRTREDREKKYFRGAQTKRRAIIESALEELKLGRPVLIGTVSEAEINGLKAHLENQTKESGKKIRVLEFTAASEEIFAQDKENLSPKQFEEKYGVGKKEYKDYKSLIKKEAGKPDTITLGTSILGRGTTIKTSKDVNEVGGIHVIIDGLHETSSRNQEQYKARTARGDNKGSTQEFFCYADIPEEVRRASYKNVTADEIYREVYEKIDARTSGIRNYVVQFVEKTNEKLAEIDEMTFLDEAQRQQAKALLAQRAFSIKNRACGVSDKFQTNIQEYERELNAYAALYVAKYCVTDEKYFAGGRFDEVKWLEDNDYEDIAQMHMPFKKARETEIFRSNGIKGKIRKEKIVEKRDEEKRKAAEELERQSGITPVKGRKQSRSKSTKATTGPIRDEEISVLPVEEMIVAEPEVTKEVAIDATQPTIEKPKIELGKINLDFNSKDIYSQLLDLEEAQTTQNEEPRKESAMSLLGMKNVVTDPKWAITWSKIKAFTNSIMRVFRVQPKTPKEAQATQGVQESQEFSDTDR